uniref:C2H2-type domain-containing protein n=1 Tax=Maylandia zebra TaxID=106582 RepID=A0A3P9D293_9CICH
MEGVTVTEMQSCSMTAFHSLPLFVSLSLQDQREARSQGSQEADKPHRRKGEETYSCDLCGKSFNWAGSLKRHQLIHSGVKPYSCDECGKSFTQAGHLKTHQLIHNGVKPYSCDLCGKSFTQAGGLKNHKLIHSGVKEYICGLCAKAFARNEHLQKHRVTHSGIKATFWYKLNSSSWGWKHHAMGLFF